MSTCFLLATDDSQKPFFDALNKKLIAKSPIPIMLEEAKDWWDKPKLILNALNLFDKVIWLDNDIEIVDDRFFDIVDAPAVSAAIDYPMTGHFGIIQYNTGVLVMNKECATSWAQRLNKKKRSDQECFPAEMVDTVLSPAFNNLRLDVIKRHTVYARHWTGPIGKQQLKERIESGTYGNK